jgi:uncharacterized RDD family membrane protein YckC
MAYQQYQPYPQQPQAQYQQYRDPTAVMGRRILAYVIDALITAVVFVIAFAALAHQQAVPGNFDNACDFIRDNSNVRQCFQSGNNVYYLEGGEAAVLYLVAIGVSALNNAVLQGLSGASVGKFVTGLRTVNEEGQTCGIGRAVVRWLFLIVDAYFCFLIGLITALVSKGHRRVGDMVAKTYVIGARDVGTPPLTYVGDAPPRAAAAEGWESPPPAPPEPRGGWRPPGT